MFKKYDPKMLMWALVSLLIGVSMVVGIPQSALNFNDAINELAFMFFAFMLSVGFMIAAKR